MSHILIEASQEPERMAKGISGINDRARTFYVWLFLIFSPPQIAVGVGGPSDFQTLTALSSPAEAKIFFKTGLKTTL